MNAYTVGAHPPIYRQGPIADPPLFSPPPRAPKHRRRPASSPQAVDSGAARRSGVVMSLAAIPPGQLPRTRASPHPAAAPHTFLAHIPSGSPLGKHTGRLARITTEDGPARAGPRVRRQFAVAQQPPRPPLPARLTPLPTHIRTPPAHRARPSPLASARRPRTLSTRPRLGPGPRHAPSSPRTLAPPPGPCAFWDNETGALVIVVKGVDLSSFTDRLESIRAKAGGPSGMLRAAASGRAGRRRQRGRG